jgi:2'-5' RNA ligase
MTTDAPAPLLELQRRLAHRLARSPRAKAGDRFLPHLTLCRFSGGARAPRIDEPTDISAFAVDHVMLMRSVLRPSGAEHSEVARVALEA